MQRDETLLLEPWLRYHGCLFGFENLVVLDNGSTSRDVVATLRRAECAGVDVRWVHRERRDFLGRGVHASNIVRFWQERGDSYDAVAFLACDELLVTWTRGGLACDRTAVHAEIERGLADAAGRTLRIDNTLLNVHGRPGWFVLEDVEKHVLPAHLRQHPQPTVGNDFRHAVSALAEGSVTTSLVTLHYRHKPFRIMRDRARRALAEIASLGDGGSMAAYEGALAGTRDALVGGEAGYLRKFDDRLQLGVPGIGDLLGALGIESTLLAAPTEAWRRVPRDQVAVMCPARDFGPSWFDGATYLANNPDVDAAGWPAALHFLRHGGSEERPAPEAELGDRQAARHHAHAFAGLGAA